MKEYKHKLNITLDKDIKESLNFLSEKKGITRSAMITYLVLAELKRDKRRKK